MQIRNHKIYRGSNRWSHQPVMEVEFFVQDHHQLHIDDDAAFVDRLKAAIPNFFDRIAIESQSGIQRNDVQDDQPPRGASASIGKWLERIVIGYASTVGTVLGFSATEPLSANSFLIAIQYEEAALTRHLFETGLRLLKASLAGDPWNATFETRRLVDLADDIRLGPSTRAITEVAQARGIPCMRLTSGSLVQLGEGSGQRRIWATETDATSAMAESIAGDKDLTKRLLRMAGVPVPAGRIVDSAEDAWLAAKEIGFPVVVKPQDANHGRGISFDLSDRQQILDAFDVAFAESPNVMVEQFARGYHHRLLVVGGRFLAASKGRHEYVVGDGKRTIRELVDEVNRDPCRGENYTDALDILKLNDSALIQLKRQSHTPDSVPAKGEQVIIKLNGDLTTDVTDEVHPEVAKIAVLATQVVGLDVGGLDLIAQDISRPLHEQQGMIIEVNAAPGLSHHVSPLQGKPRPVGSAIVDLLFPNTKAATVPIVLVSGEQLQSTIVQYLQRWMQQFYEHVGVVNEEGAWVDDLQISSKNSPDLERWQSIVMHPKTDAILFANRAEETLQYGLGYHRANVTVITDLPADKTQWPATLATIHASHDDGSVVLMDDLIANDLIMKACGSRAIVICPSAMNSDVRAYVANGGAAISMEGQSMTFRVGSTSRTFSLPASRGRSIAIGRAERADREFYFQPAYLGTMTLERVAAVMGSDADNTSIRFEPDALIGLGVAWGLGLLAE